MADSEPHWTKLNDWQNSSEIVAHSRPIYTILGAFLHTSRPLQSNNLSSPITPQVSVPMASPPRRRWKPRRTLKGRAKLEMADIATPLAILAFQAAKPVRPASKLTHSRDLRFAAEVGYVWAQSLSLAAAPHGPQHCKGLDVSMSTSGGTGIYTLASFGQPLLALNHC